MGLDLYAEKKERCVLLDKGDVHQALQLVMWVVVVTQIAGDVGV